MARQARSFLCEFLEPRMLLSTAHTSGAHATAAAVTPLVLDGTLSVDNNAAVSITNPDGSTTTSTPVAGRFGTLGELRGVWNETVDEYGDSEGMDVLRLAGSKGTIIVEFDTDAAGPARPAGHDAVYYQEPQRIYSGTGAYARTSEAGTIQVYTNSGRSEIESMTLHTRGT
jgi:hypothetical protein